MANTLSQGLTAKAPPDLLIYAYVRMPQPEDGGSSHVSAFKILIVDDNIDNLRFLANILTQQGYQVRKVLNGHMALTAAKSSPPDLILLDINMPQLNGYEVCQTLKADPATAAIPVIFISALDDVLDRVRAYTVGGVDYITKPFQFEEVVARVGTQLRLQALTQALAQQQHQTKQAELAYQHLFERVKQGIYHLTVDGLYLQINSTYAEILGYGSVAELLEKVGDRPQSLYVDPEHWLTLMEQMYEQHAITDVISQVYHASGTSIDLLESLYAVGEPPERPMYYLGIVQLA